MKILFYRNLRNILEAAVPSLQGQTLAAVLLSHDLHHHPICKFANNIKKRADSEILRGGPIMDVFTP